MKEGSTECTSGDICRVWRSEVVHAMNMSQIAWRPPGRCVFNASQPILEKLPVGLK